MLIDAGRRLSAPRGSHFRLSISPASKMRAYANLPVGALHSLLHTVDWISSVSFLVWCEGVEAVRSVDALGGFPPVLK